MDISEQLEKEKKIKQEINRLKKLYKEFDKDKAKALEGLIYNAAFMKISLNELREDLLINGVTELFEQGEQCFKRERPEYKVYSTFIQRYSQVMKQLIDLLPVEEKKTEEDALMEFVKKGRIKK
ncbi:MAG: hypothetical protein PUE01_08160 [Clostridiaceae bacterium]|nr:hypothetical protein [Clostridiaceae bacterium]